MSQTFYELKDKNYKGVRSINLIYIIVCVCEAQPHWVPKQMCSLIYTEKCK